MDFRPHMANVIASIGREVSYFPLDGETRIVDGVYESPPREFLGIESCRPSISCLAREIPNPMHGDGFEWDGKRFRVVEIERDDASGLCKLYLEVKA